LIPLGRGFLRSMELKEYTPDVKLTKSEYFSDLRGFDHAFY